MAAPWIAPQGARLPSARGDIDVLRIDLGGVPRGAVVVLPTAGALHRDAGAVMNRLAAQGYESVAMDVSAAAGGSAGLVEAAMTGLAQRGWSAEQVGLIGYGAGGGPAALMAAATGASLGAAVSVAPVWTAEPASALRSAARSAHLLRTPWLGLFGSGDANAPARAVAALAEALGTRAPVFSQLVVYPGVAGAFYLDSAQAAVHAAAYDSWQRTVEWLNLRVVPRLTPRAQAWRQAHPEPVPSNGI
jgi:carboxymethylenebutenolidase